jgi:predicted  nucleic acid-binding Zn-ribbon protein
MMTIWEKAILNMERGSKRVTVAAALFADRVRVEINVIRMRIRIDEVQERMDELYQTIGRQVVNLARGDALPKTTEQLIKNDDIATAMTELADRKQEIAELREMIVSEQATEKENRKQAEGASE